MGRIVDRIDVDQRALLVGEPDNLRYVIDGPHRIRGVADGHDAGARTDFLLQIREVEGAVAFVDVDEPNVHAALFEGAPGRDIGIVVEVVSRISSPGPSSRPMDRLMAKVSVVMLGPMMPSGSLPKKSAMAARALSTTASVRWLVAYAP